MSEEVVAGADHLLAQILGRGRPEVPLLVVEQTGELEVSTSDLASDLRIVRVERNDCHPEITPLQAGGSPSEGHDGGEAAHVPSLEKEL